MQDTIAKNPPPGARPTRGRADTSETGEFLLMSFEGGEEGTQVRLIGSYPGRSLVITAPEVDGRLLFVKEGQVFHFRSFYAQAVYAFSTSIQKVCFTPFPYIHLDWPKGNIERTVVRRSRRVEVKLPCAVYWDLDGSTHTYNGTLRNLSTDGAELHMGRPIPARGENARVAFRLQIGALRYLVECPIKVMRHELIAGKDDTTLDKYGVQLLEIPQEATLALHAFVHETAVTRLETPIYAQSAT
jgi:c-di-GMP-binding flagellar brake protein YcgR